MKALKIIGAVALVGAVAGAITGSQVHRRRKRMMLARKRHCPLCRKHRR